MMSPGFSLLIFCLMFPALSEQRGIWNVREGFEYYVSNKTVSKSYDDSQKFCQAKDGQLALVKTRQIHAFITTLVTDESDAGRPYGFFIGLRVLDGNRTFEWNDGSALVFEQWEGGEPNNDGGIGNCVHMGQRYTHDHELKWYDVQCTIGTPGPAGFVCQRKIGWYWSDWTEVSSCNCSGILERRRNCTDTGRHGPYICNETDIENQTQNCSAPDACYTTTTPEEWTTSNAKEPSTTSTATTTTAEATSERDLPEGSPAFLIPVAASAGGIVLIVIGILICCVLYERRKRAEEEPEIEAVAELQAGGAELEYATVGVSNKEGASDGEYATLGNSNPPANSEYCTLNLEASTSSYKAPQSVNGTSRVGRNKKRKESNKGHKVTKLTTPDKEAGTDPVYTFIAPSPAPSPSVNVVEKSVEKSSPDTAAKPVSENLDKKGAEEEKKKTGTAATKYLRIVHSFDSKKRKVHREDQIRQNRWSRTIYSRSRHHVLNLE